MSEHQEVLRKARERWMEGEADALPDRLLSRGPELLGSEE